MKCVFIDRQLCTLVTQEGIAHAWPNTSAEMVLGDLKYMGLIDDTGCFLTSATVDSIQSFCTTWKVSPGYLNTMYTMQRYIRDLSDKELSFWSHKIHELQLRIELQDIVEGDIDDFSSDTMLMYAQMLVRQFGNNVVSKFMDILRSKQGHVEITLLISLLRKCASKKWIFEIVIDQMKESVSFAQALEDLKKFNWEMELRKQRTTVEIITSMKSKLPRNSDHLYAKFDAIIQKVNAIKLIEEKRMPSCITKLRVEHYDKPVCEYTVDNIEHWVRAFRDSSIQRSKDPFEHRLFVEAFAVIRRGVTIFYESKKHQTGIRPRDTQMVASLLFFQNLSVQQGASQGTRLMQQISTGEGKTMIICMTAILKVLMGEKVDIVTSSSVLATRDAAEQSYLYHLFDVSVSHCCHEDLTKRKQCYESDVVYGDIGSFQRDILETKFYGRAIRTNHKFDNVIIDEVDSMLVDKGETMLYLPHPLPDLSSLHLVYLEIWSMVNARDFIGFPDEQDRLYEYLNLKIFGGLPTNAFTAVSGITEKESMDIHSQCIKLGLINGEDYCLVCRDSVVIQRKFGAKLQPEVMLIIQQHLDNTPLIETIPKPLHQFVRKSLKSWIQSAVSAKYFRPNKEYIVDIDHRESAADRYPKIVIMDNETGVEQESSEWGSGLHQFLQLKHHLRLSTESLKAVYMSNISFFTPSYNNILGVTGTLGSIAEHTLFNKLYENTQLVVLPTDKPSRLRIEEPKCYSTIEHWEKAIGEDVQEKQENRRAVLLICEDVERARYLHQHLIKNYNCDSELYTSSHQKKLEETGESEPGRVIIATNLAGRGTDIKLSRTVKQNGGLHVCLSYLPPNVRVELQAYGRAARSGDQGSCKLIFHDKDGDISYAISKRNLKEAQRVGDIEADYYHNIKFQEELFEEFTAIYNAIRDDYNGKPEGRPELDYCLDCWAYFLDRYTDVIKSIPNKPSDSERDLEKKRLRRAFDKEVRHEIEQKALSPARSMQKGHLYMKQAVKRRGKYKDATDICSKDYSTAIEAYKQAMNQNPSDPFARYYVAAARFNHVFQNKNTTFDSGKEDRTKLKQEFYHLLPLFQSKIKSCESQISALRLANRHQDQSLTGDIHYFDGQKQHEIELYRQFIVSMQDVIGSDITPKIFDHANWGEEGSVIAFEMVREMFSP